MTRKYLAFQIGEGQFGVALDDVGKIIRFENVTDVPTAPPFIEGVLNLGGEVIPVVNLRMRFSLPRETVTRRHRVIVVERERRRFGLLVDGVREILQLDDENVVNEGISMPGVKAEFVLGIAKIQETLLVVLDIFRVLTAPVEAVSRTQP